MGLFDFFRRPKPEGAGPPEATPPAKAPSFISGPSTPSSDEPWPFTVRHVSGDAIRLDYVSLQGVQQIHGVHERLAAQLGAVPDGMELHFLCRVADGLHYNVKHLIAVALADTQADGALEFVPDEYVTARPALQVRRALGRIQRGNFAGAIADLRVGFAHDFDQAGPGFRALPVSERGPLLSAFADWVARRPLTEAHAALLPLAQWSTEHLKQAASLAHRTEQPWTGHDLDALTAELERRESQHAEVFKALIEQRDQLRALLSPELLKPELLADVLDRRDDGALGVYADTLCEARHPYGEFLALHRKGDRASLREAKRVAVAFERAWLGPIEAFVEADYERGLPVTARLTCDAPPSFDWAAASTHPMLRAFRRLEVKRTKKARRGSADPDDVARLARALAPLSLTALDCGGEVLSSLEDVDLSRVTELLELDLLDRGQLMPSRFPRVERVRVAISPGHTGATLEWLSADSGGFFAARRPHLDLVFRGTPSEPELARVRDAAKTLSVLTLTVSGAPLP